jgi:hypothetical protein
VTRRRRAAILGALAFLVVPALAQAQSPSLSGSVYRQAPSARAPSPVRGLEVYLYSQRTRWIGPAMSDGYGRFAFFNVAPGRYLLRVYSDKRVVWQGEVTVPGRVEPIVLPAP